MIEKIKQHMKQDLATNKTTIFTIYIVAFLMFSSSDRSENDLILNILDWIMGIFIVVTTIYIVTALIFKKMGKLE
jgi:Mn2+/Fe2+ NRAMP family transporter